MGTSTSTQITSPYSGAKPMVDESLKAAQGLYQGGALYMQPYGGQMVANAAPATLQGWGDITNLATQGSPLNQMSSDYVQRILDPNFLNSQTPGLGGVLDQARNSANAQISLAGRTGSGSHEAAVAGALAPILYQDYGNKMALQSQMAQFAPQLAQQDYFDANQLLNVGQQQQGLLQDQIDAEMQKYYAQQGAKANELGLYQDLISGNYGGTTVMTQPKVKSGSNSNPWLTGLGAAASVASSFFS